MEFTLFLASYRMIMEGDRLLSGEDVATDDLLHLVVDHIRYAQQYNFTDGPVKLPFGLLWSVKKFQVIFIVLI